MDKSGKGLKESSRTRIEDFPGSWPTDFPSFRGAEAMLQQPKTEAWCSSQKQDWDLVTEKKIVELRVGVSPEHCWGCVAKIQALKGDLSLSDRIWQNTRIQDWLHHSILLFRNSFKSKTSVQWGQTHGEVYQRDGHLAPLLPPKLCHPCFSFTLRLFQNTGLLVSLNSSAILSYGLGSEVQNGSQQTETKLLARMYASGRLRLMNIGSTDEHCGGSSPGAILWHLKTWVSYPFNSLW